MDVAIRIGGDMHGCWRHGLLCGATRVASSMDASVLGACRLLAALQVANIHHLSPDSVRVRREGLRGDARGVMVRVGMRVEVWGQVARLLGWVVRWQGDS